jgi:hypothetical protein
METEILLIPRPSGPARPVSPDTSVSRIEQGRSSEQPPVGATPALLEVDEPIGESRQSWIEVRRRDWSDPHDRFGSRIVSVIEVLSPSSKGLYGERHLRKFLGKRGDYLSSTVSYLEIDLLSAGTRELPSPVEKLAEHPFVAWSSQVQQRSRHYWAWGWQQSDPLPSVVLPLDYPHIRSFDLGTHYQRACETNRWTSRLEFVEARQTARQSRISDAW